jgi:transcriptional regulator with XRE-family HTH domain
MADSADSQVQPRRIPDGARDRFTVKDAAGLRKAVSKMTQAKVAEEAGISTSMVGHLLPSEDGSRPPRRDTVYRDVAVGISLALGVPLTKFFREVPRRKGA